MPFKIITPAVFLPLILFIGFMTSIQDFKTSKIKNQWIKIGLLYSIVIYSLSWILYWLALQKVIGPVFLDISSYLLWNFDKWCINLFISTVMAYLLWHFDMWGAGDAKLFITYAALIPMSQYSKIYFSYYFASFLLLFSIFVPVTIYLFIKAGYRYLKKNSLKETTGKVNKLLESKITKTQFLGSLKVLIGFAFFFLFYSLLRREASGIIGNVLPDQNIVMVICLVAFRPLSKIFKKKIIYAIIFFIFFSVYIVFKTESSLEGYLLLVRSTFSKSLLIILLFPIIQRVIVLCDGNSINKTTPFAMWMFLGALITWII